MALAPRLPVEKSPMCMPPPRPRLYPSSLPNSSAITLYRCSSSAASRSASRVASPAAAVRARSCSSVIWRRAEKPFAIASPCPRWELVTLSVMRRTDEAPTADASWPMDTCVGPR